MNFSERFICSSPTMNEYENHVNAPLFRRVFDLRTKNKARIQICGLGFYRAFLNGKEITKGKLAPYISNTDEVVYYDVYEAEKYVKVGKNVLTVLLGNGLQNGIGGEVFEFDKASWRTAPKLAVAFYAGDELLFEADERFECALSPITFDDLWAGEHYDARLERTQKWKSAVRTNTPKGEKREASAFAVTVKKTVKPRRIIPYRNGYIYDFGINTAGVCRLKIRARAGQKISLYHFEIFQNGEICRENISFGKRTRENYWQQDEYIAKDGNNVYEPSFTYHGFRYVYVEGLTKKQAKKSALTMLVLTSAAKSILKFSCSDKRLNKLVAMVINSDESNFLYYPTDCPHREKNGWTGDAMLSAEQMLMSANVDDYLKEWLFCMRKSQKENGRLPRIVPSGAWGYTSGESGPNWDGALIEIAYRLYEKEGDKKVLRENLPAIEKYLRYLSEMRNEKGLLSFGLGDREETFTGESSAHNTPNEVTDTLTAVELCEKTEKMAEAVADQALSEYARILKEQLKTAFRTQRTDAKKRVVPFTQTGQCMLVAAKIFEGADADAAVQNLVELLKKDGVVKMGVIGYRKLFDVLAEHGEAALACRLLLTENYSGYLYYVKKGMTSMPESFLDYEDQSFVRKDGGKPLGLNHHWYGHILGGIVKYIVGLRFADFGEGKLVVDPFYAEGIQRISATMEIRNEKVELSWRKRRNKIHLKIKTSYPNIVLKRDERATDFEVKIGTIRWCITRSREKE